MNAISILILLLVAALLLLALKRYCSAGKRDSGSCCNCSMSAHCKSAKQHCKNNKPHGRPKRVAGKSDQ